MVWAEIDDNAKIALFTNRVDEEGFKWKLKFTVNNGEVRFAANLNYDYIDQYDEELPTLLSNKNIDDEFLKRFKGIDLEKIKWFMLELQKCIETGDISQKMLESNRNTFLGHLEEDPVPEIVEAATPEGEVDDEASRIILGGWWREEDENEDFED